MPPTSLFVPGRLCLLGEHSDWAAGHRRTHGDLARGACLVAGTNQGLHATVVPLAGVLEIASVLPDGTRVGPERLELDRGTLDAAARGEGFFRYAAGVAAEMVDRGARQGASLVIERMDLPLRKGLSSSAAACVLVARALALVNEMPLDLDEEMDVAFRGERRTGSECGRMDQVCALGRRTTLLSFDGDDMAIETVTPGGSIHVLVVDLGRVKDTRRILADLNRCFPDAPGERARRVRDALGASNLAVVLRGREAIEAGDARELGAVMTEAQELFDRDVAPACPELLAPHLHEVLALDAVRELAWGGKGVGSQGDGCAQLVARGREERDMLARRLERELGVACLSLTLEG